MNFNSIPVFDSYDDIKNGLVEKYIYKKNIKQKYILKLEIPKLPLWTDKEIYVHGQYVNPFRLTCTCLDFSNRSKIYQNRDFRKVCVHLARRLTGGEISQCIDSLTKMLLESSTKFEVNNFYKIKFNDAELIIGYKSLNNWIDIYYLKEDSFNKYSYSFKQRRWSYGEIPGNTLALINHVKKFLDFINK